MFLRYRSDSIPIAGSILAIIGFVFSLSISFGIGLDLLCVTDGCNLVSNLRFFGLSPWWLSALAFLVLAVLLFFRFRTFGYLLASLMLLGDIALLALMVFIAPCVNCLIVAILIVCTWASLRTSSDFLQTPRKIIAGGLGLVWFLLFIINVGVAGNSLVSNWKISGVDNAKIQVYFSPTCVACLDAINRFEGRADFYAVSRGDDDLLMLGEIIHKIDSGINFAVAVKEVKVLDLEALKNNSTLSAIDKICLQISLMRNEARLRRLNISLLPALVVEGMPTSWVTTSSEQILDIEQEGVEAGGMGSHLDTRHLQEIAPLARDNGTLKVLENPLEGSSFVDDLGALEILESLKATMQATNKKLNEDVVKLMKELEARGIDPKKIFEDVKDSVQSTSKKMIEDVGNILDELLDEGKAMNLKDMFTPDSPEASDTGVKAEKGASDAEVNGKIETIEEAGEVGGNISDPLLGLDPDFDELNACADDPDSCD